jgi:hypothetical protein
MSPFGDLTGLAKEIGSSDLMALLLTWGVYIANRHKEHAMYTRTCNVLINTQTLI